MPAENCDEKKCPMNRPNGKFHKCGIDVLSLIDGKCEFYEAYKESKRLDKIDEMRGDKVVQL